MKISDVIDSFLTGKHSKGNYLVYALKPYKTYYNELHAKGTYIIKDEEATKRKYAKITNRKHINLIATIIVGE